MTSIHERIRDSWPSYPTMIATPKAGVGSSNLPEGTTHASGGSRRNLSRVRTQRVGDFLRVCVCLGQTAARERARVDAPHRSGGPGRFSGRPGETASALVMD